MKASSKRRLFMVGAIAVAASALGAVAFGNMGENLVYYWGPAELVAHGDAAVGATVRLGGLVQEGTVNWQPENNSLAFEVAEGDARVKVHATGAPPQMFREGIGVVVEGTLTPAGVFESDRLMVKHSNEYRAPDAEMTAAERKELYDAVLAGEGAP